MKGEKGKKMTNIKKIQSALPPARHSQSQLMVTRRVPSAGGGDGVTPGL